MYTEPAGTRPSGNNAPIGTNQTNPNPTTPNTSDPQTTPSETPQGQPSPTPTLAFRTITREDATKLPRPDTIPLPNSISIPNIDVEAPIDVVGLDDRNYVEVPHDVSRTGWYQYSAKPSTPIGSSVIVGHVDGVTQGAGAFFNLRKLNPGDTITVTLQDGTPLNYTVVSREIFSKSNAPLRELFSKNGPERLTLITCGGPFDPATLGYTDNIVITATPTTKN